MSVLTFPSKNLLILNSFECTHSSAFTSFFSPFLEDICLSPPLLLRSGVFEEDFVFFFFFLMCGKFIEYFPSSPPTMWWWEEKAQCWEFGAMVLILILSLTSERTLSQPFLFLLGVSSVFICKNDGTTRYS